MRVNTARIPVAAAASTLVLILSACTASESVETESPAPSLDDPEVTATIEADPASSEPAEDPDISVSRSPSPTVTPEPTAVDPATGEWLIRADGIGPVMLGDPFSAYDGHLDDDAREQLEWCPVLFLDQWDDTVHDGWRMTARGDAEDERVVAQIVVREGGENVAAASTAEGVGLDATADDVLAAYPDARRVESAVLDSPKPYNLVIDRDGTPIAFEISSETDEVIGVAVGTEAPAYEFCG